MPAQVATSVTALLLLATAASGLPHAAAAAAAASSTAVVDEVAILWRLRQALWLSDPDWAGAWHAEWRPGGRAHPCSWDGIVCNSQGHVKQISIQARVKGARNRAAHAAPAHGTTSPLLPDLGQLQWLDMLGLVHTAGHGGGLSMPSIPAQWLAPGAFPRLTWLSLAGRSLATPLPDFPPGVLPRLERLDLEFHDLQTTLPPSWGTNPAALPSLQYLTVSVQVEGTLPPAWAQGFPNLRGLTLLNLPPNMEKAAPFQGAAAYITQWRAAARAGERRGIGGRSGTVAAAQQLPRQHRLPPSWAAGFAQLQMLGLYNLGLSGTLPEGWLHGAFPNLVDISLPFNELTGTLPSFSSMPKLSSITLSDNHFTGGLPDAWAASQLIYLSIVNNSLSGPAFPPAWLRPGSLPKLRVLDIVGNQGLTGTLPAGLPWPKLQKLYLRGTGLHGSVPSAWCKAPFAEEIEALQLHGTAVDPTLPPCPVHTMHGLFKLSANATAGRIPDQRAQPAAAGGVIAVLPALVAAGALGRVLWQRRARQIRAQWREEIGQASVGPDKPRRHGGTSGVAAEATAAACAAAVVTQAACAGSGGGSSGSSGWSSGRLDRLQSLLSLHVGRRHPVEWYRLGEVPADVAPRGAAADVDALGHYDSVAEHVPLLDPPEDLAAELGLEPGGTSHGYGPVGAQAAPAGPQRWGLQSTSLQLWTGDLEFVTDDQGFVVLGAGAHAVVYLGKLQDHHFVAVKVVELLPSHDSQAVWREVGLLRRCTHPRVVPLLGVAAKGQLLMLAMALMPGGSLKAALQTPALQERLRWEAAGCQVALDVAEGLAFLHSDAHVRHGDLKPGNVLLTSGMRACISDLGLSQVADGAARTAKGFTILHAAPEQLLGMRCTLAADIYSFGVLLAELTTRTVARQRGKWRLPGTPEECPQGVLDLLLDCISPEPELRPTAEQAWQRLQAACQGGT